MTALPGRLLSCDGVDLYVECHGSGPPLLMLHGFAGSVAAMRELATELARDSTVYVVDLPGHGRSEAPRDVRCYRMERCISQLLALFDTLGLQRVGVLGYSMGARVALSLCAAHPERVCSALLLGVSPGILNPDDRRARVAADDQWVRRLREDGLEAFMDDWIDRPLFAGFKRLDQQRQSEQRALRLAQRPHGLMLSLQGMGTGVMPPLHTSLAEIDCPVALVVGELDVKFRTIARELLKYLPRASLSLVSGAGHAAHVENTDEFVAIARRFFARAGAPGRLDFGYGDP